MNAERMINKSPTGIRTMELIVNATESSRQ